MGKNTAPSYSTMYLKIDKKYSKVMLLHRLPNPIIFWILDSDCKEKLPFQ